MAMYARLNTRDSRSTRTSGSGCPGLLLPSVYVLTGLKFLGAPAEHLGRKDGAAFVDGDLVRIEMRAAAWLWAAEDADDLTVAINLQNAARDGVGHVDKVIECDNQAKGMPEPPFAQILPAGIENLNARVLAVADIDQIAVNHNGVRQIKLSRTGTLHAPAHQRIAIPIEFQNARVAVAIRDVDVALAVEGTSVG